MGPKGPPPWTRVVGVVAAGQGKWQLIVSLCDCFGNQGWVAQQCQQGGVQEEGCPPSSLDWETEKYHHLHLQQWPLNACFRADSGGYSLPVQLTLVGVAEPQ